MLCRKSVPYAVPHIKYRHLFSEKSAHVLNKNTNNVKIAFKTCIWTRLELLTENITSKRFNGYVV